MTTGFHISARNLGKTFPMTGSLTGTKQVLRDISFRIGEGEQVGVIGRNGAGKTTLLQLIAGIGVPTSGHVDVAGNVTSVFTLGMGLREDLSGRENIVIDGELQGRTRSEIEKVMPETIAFAALGDFIDRPVRTYSTGMKARLSFAMLVHIEPEILIVDEALSVGDANFSRKATAKMRELTQRGKILIVVSHSMSSICDMCNRCLWLDNGVLRMDGTPQEVTAAYLNEVRQVDEKVLVKRFRRQMVQESLLPGWDIGAMQFREPGNGRAVNILQTGEPVCLHLDVTAPPGEICQAELELFRLDQVSVCISDSGNALPELAADASGRLELIADLGILPLNFGIYAARAVIRHKGSVAARRTIFMEVVNPVPHKGGRALIVTPVHISSQKAAS